MAGEGQASRRFAQRLSRERQVSRGADRMWGGGGRRIRGHQVVGGGFQVPPRGVQFSKREGRKEGGGRGWSGGGGGRVGRSGGGERGEEREGGEGGRGRRRDRARRRVPPASSVRCVEVTGRWFGYPGDADRRWEEGTRQAHGARPGGAAPLAAARWTDVGARRSPGGS